MTTGQEEPKRKNLHSIDNKALKELVVVCRWDFCISSHLYAIKKEFPVIGEFGRRIRTVEKELNRDCHERKPKCDKVCRCRQKH